MKRVTDSGLVGRMTESDGRKGDLLFDGMGKDNKDLVVVQLWMSPSQTHAAPHIFTTLVILKNMLLLFWKTTNSRSIKHNTIILFTYLFIVN